MGSISVTDAQALFTNMIVDVYKQQLEPTAFLRSYFPTVEAPTKEISIEVMRNMEKIAVDVVRGSEGNRNNFSKSSQKIFEPPYFREFIELTQLQLYDRLYGATTITDTVFVAYVNDVADKLRAITAKIERAYELQCAQVLETGIVTMKNGVNIDFKRKADSKIDFGGGSYWANNINPFDQLAQGAKFLREVGKSQGPVFNVIMGGGAHSDLLKNTEFLKRQNLFNLNLDQVAPPQRTAVGSSYHGQISVGSYRLNMWTYPQTYDNASNVATPYLDDANVIMIPENPRFKLSFAATPQLLMPGATPKMGAYVFGEYIDQRGKSHIMDVESAGLAIPTAVDQIWTAKVKA